jgi:hypothetical protein
VSVTALPIMKIAIDEFRQLRKIKKVTKVMNM